MPMHLPPWWEIHNDASSEDVSQPRASEISRPSPRRDILWGPALAAGLADRLLAVYHSEEWAKSTASTDAGARNPFTVGVHRDWLMTPREDLDGGIPRQSLHGGMDGHHLELDNEFAFSLCETREEWERQQQEFAETSAAIDASIKKEKEEAEPPDEFASPWQNSFVADDLPGDPMGHLAISFQLAEMITELKDRNAAQADVDALNQAFGEYRRAEVEQRGLATERFKEVLEQTAQRHESLVGCAADLQSRLDELLRRPVADDIGDPGF